MTDTESDGDDAATRRRWFYGVMAVLGLAGVGLIGYTLGASDGAEQTTVKTTGPASSSPRSGAGSGGAGGQGAYWAMHDRLFENQDEWSGFDDPLQAFRRYAATIGIDGDRLARCVRSGAKRGVVATNRQLGQALGVSSTPTIVVGSKGIRGAASWGRMKQVIDAALGEARAGREDRP